MQSLMNDGELLIIKFIRRNLVHCSTCWAIKSTEIGDEFLSLNITRKIELDLPKLTNGDL
jgi:hypothetical protein